MTGLETLKQVLTILKRYKSGSNALEALLNNDILHSSFERRYILNTIHSEFHLISENAKSDKWVEFYLDSLDGSPFKVEIVFEERWRLKSFLFQCQGCFGEDEKCSVCGGSGWGVL